MKSSNKASEEAKLAWTMPSHSQFSCKRVQSRTCSGYAERSRKSQSKTSVGNERLAAIVLNFNSCADTRKCVAFLQRQQGVDLEIILVDNCSRQEDAAAVERLAAEKGCTFIRAEENRGYNAGNNIGLRRAAEKGYEFALIANPDMEFPDPHYAAHLLAALRGHGEAAVAATDIASPDEAHQNPMPPDAKGWGAAFMWLRILAKRGGAERNFAQTHFCRKVSGCCLMVRTDFINEIGFFDEQVFLYCEEAILARQAEALGRKMLYVADLHAVHRHIKSAKGNAAPRFKAWVASRLYFERRYNYQGPLLHLAKSAGWKTYAALMCFKSWLKTSCFSRRVNK